jgi:hypothetical protein
MLKKPTSTKTRLKAEQFDNFYRGFFCLFKNSYFKFLIFLNLIDLAVARNLIEQLSAPRLIKCANAKGMKNLLEQFKEHALKDTACLSLKSYEFNEVAFRYELFSDENRVNQY